MKRFQSNDVNTSSSLGEICEPEPPDLVESKEHLRTLYQDRKFQSMPMCVDVSGTCQHNKQLNDLDIKITQCIEQNNQTHLKLNGFKHTIDLLLHKFGLQDPTLLHYIGVKMGEDDLQASSALDLVERKISTCILSNKLTHSKIDNLQKSLNLILKNIDTASIDSGTSAEEPSVDNNVDDVVFRFPISSVNELNRLDEQLQQNENLMENLIEKFTRIAGDSGNKSAKKVGVKIIERIISAKLLTEFTWTGRTNGTNNKLPFITYTSIFNLCLQVISKADRSFDTNACENFIKNNILKHSSMRLSRKFNRKIKRGKLKDEIWCTTSELMVKKSEQQFPTETEKQNSDIEEDLTDSKANLKDLIDAQNSKAEEDSHCFAPNSVPNKCDYGSKLDGLDRKLSHCIESNSKVHSKIDNMQETLNIILNKLGCGQSFDRASVPVPVYISAPASASSLGSEKIDDELDSFFFPLTSVSDLQDLNNRLSMSDGFREKMIQKFISIAGHGKKFSTQRFGLEVVESVISPQLLMKYSWTGRSKSIEPKMAFMKFKYLVDFFQKVISKVDKRFTPKECEAFLRFSVFKYVNVRAARTRGKIKAPMSEFDSDHEIDQEFQMTGEDLTVEALEKEQSCDFEHLSAVELAEANLES